MSPQTKRAGRTLLSAALDFDFSRSNVKVKGGGQECPPCTLIGAVPGAFCLAHGPRIAMWHGRFCFGEEFPMQTLHCFFRARFVHQKADVSLRGSLADHAHLDTTERTIGLA